MELYSTEYSVYIYSIHLHARTDCLLPLTGRAVCMELPHVARWEREEQCQNAMLRKIGALQTHG